MATDLARIGRSGIVNTAKKRSGFIKSGYREIDSVADFMQGMVATIGTDSEVEVASNTSKKVLGVFNNHKTANFYRPIVEEEVTFVGADLPVNLANQNLRADYAIVTDSTGGTVYTEGTDYALDDPTGVITHDSGGAIGATDTVKISYLYKDTGLSEIDDTEGAGRVSLMEGEGEIALLIYDVTKINSTANKFAVGEKVTADANGLASTGGSAGQLGYVTKVPTNADPELHVQMEIVSTF